MTSLRDDGGRTALHYFSLSGMTGIIQAMIPLGVDLDIQVCSPLFLVLWVGMLIHRPYSVCE